MRVAAIVGALVLAAATAAAQEPRVVNASVERRAVSGGLERFFDALVGEQASAAWIGYGVPAVPGHRAGCWGSGDTTSNSSVYYLEGRPLASGGSQTVKLEGDSVVLVLFRVENRQVGKIAIFSPECELDGGGVRFFLLTGVNAAESVGLLARFARMSGGAPDRLARTATTTLALHADQSADAALEQLVGPRQPMATRSQAAFWLGEARGERGYEILRAAIERDPSPEFRRQATSGLSRSKAPGATDTLLLMAKSDADGSVRGQALFWLAQKAGKQAATAITDAIQNDPESQVKERAVFALSQLPKDEGVPLLINVARTNKDPKVRQRAMFWLGQSKDPRAVAFFEEVLKGK